MRRRTRKALVQLVFFISAIILIIYLTQAQSHETYAWNRIRYKTASARLPESRGVCPGLATATDGKMPALVVSRVSSDGDPSWLEALADKYHLCVYRADAPPDPISKELQVPANRGHEAMAYLTFIIDNYASIPAAGAVFVHGSRWAWHNDAPDYDNAALLAALDVPAALAPWGYHNLRCDWSASTCPASVSPQGSFENSLQAVVEPWSARTASDVALPGALAALFGGDAKYTMTREGLRLRLGRGDAVRSQCCAQFVAARNNIWQHSRDEYIALRQWLLDGSDPNNRNPSAAPRDDRIAGRILSYVWHILFLKHEETADSSSLDTAAGIDLERLNRRACPRASECYCRLYGRCNLERCTAGSCRGQYYLPPDYKLPDDWAATHS